MEAPTAAGSPSIDESEVEKFSRIASEWWDPKGKFRPLHKFNPVRLEFLRSTLVSHFNLDASAAKPLSGIRLLDIGCGGGLVSEPMARLGAQVVGVDASEANIKTAMVHADEMGLNVDYRAGTAEGLLAADEPPFDAVLNLEIIEHVADPEAFLKDCAQLVRPGGLMVVATLNKTLKSLALAKIGAEYILRWLPPGTHDFSKFLSPDQICDWMADAGLLCDEPIGVTFNPLLDRWSVSRDTDVNYMVVGRKS
ncbi:MAG: bifunctional 3-demethylubiquinol 3-O-methyltransferase/2-polyprenyl-6-hydroxyphenol methylase [Sandaracinus sp.]|nr:bifunctional 3-demethylubiquinol 3-O-methyltransferase/2-polyprenyl-6-hydroxyphenol methylase [Sandaracinus sp.]MAT33655.1 bifunctional 3-demethylubiquinol 3-O-methyltransferase/2-polyprenyl-6-hydroxyphenol methylase [Ponticaulis sp.]